MTYDEAINYIHSVSNFFCKPGLDRVSELCRGLGNPQEGLKFIHIAGTNGKGSTSAMLNSVLMEAGYKVGLYTSPYVRVFNERMRVDGRNIPNDTLARLTERAKAVADRMTDRPTEFELITAIAFDYFKEEGCDLVILEVGMGGRLDATNIIDSALLSIITGISIDHTAFLGNTTSEIAAEKAGIIKSGGMVIWGGCDSAAETVIVRKAEEMQSSLYKTDYSKLEITKSDLDGTTFNYRSRLGLRISLLGEYQPKNACIVLDALDRLSDVGIRVSDEALRLGLTKAKWPARFEIIHHDPLVIFDGAHNPEGISAAVRSIERYFGDKRVVILTGVLRDKDYHSVASTIARVGDCAFTITPSNPRALSAESYAAVLTDYSCPATACEGVCDALHQALMAAKERNTALVCLGSLYTYSEIILEIEKSDA